MKHSKKSSEVQESVSKISSDPSPPDAQRKVSDILPVQHHEHPSTVDDNVISYTKEDSRSEEKIDEHSKESAQKDREDQEIYKIVAKRREPEKAETKIEKVKPISKESKNSESEAYEYSDDYDF